MAPWRAACALLVTLSIALPVETFGQGSVRGFLERDVPDEQKLEQQLQAVPDTAHLRRYLNFLAAEPHHAGSARAKVNAEYIRGLLKEWGLDAQIEQFEALIPFPTVRQLEVVSPKPFVASLREPPVAQDPDSSDEFQLPTYNAYSATGDVTGEVVYANYGLPDDYDWLSRLGISVRGKIVLTRYGRSWRGIKPKIAAERGAIGCLIYSDPRDDGYFEGDVYPQGPMRPRDGVQRGSVMDMTFYPGDPLSPGWASEEGSKRLPITEAKNLARIPVLPISYGDAQPILEQMEGPLVPRDWRGALPLTYHAGPGPVNVHLKTDFDWTTKPLYDVIATIPGGQEADEWVMAGNHHDAWVNGADDPISGVAALLETARALALVQKQGWKPRRTIKLAFWDGEEFGLLGSTEWVEKHQDELRQKGVAYLNSDNTGRGWLNVGGSHTLEAFEDEVAHAVQQPGTSVTLADFALRHASGEGQDSSSSSRTDGSLRLDALGAGSDFQGFLNYLGIASMNEGFEGQTKSGIYHSIYDSIYWYTHFSDTTQADGRALSQFTATAMLRLADASVLPFEFGRFADTVSRYAEEIQRQSELGGHKLDFVGIRKQLDALRDHSQNYEALLEVTIAKKALAAEHLLRLNQELIRSERVLTRPEGLPNRPWYKHQIYAPGFYTGYAVKTLPGIREAVEARNWKVAQQQMAIVEGCLSDMNHVLTEATAELSAL